MSNNSLHPAWPTFVQNHFPADKFEEPELLTTQEILDRLNSIIRSEFYSEEDLFKVLQNNKFRQLTPAPVGLYLWMVKTTPLKMIPEITD